jgi:hypothetical protein
MSTLGLEPFHNSDSDGLLFWQPLVDPIELSHGGTQ